jgi:hypothetical protein
MRKLMVVLALLSFSMFFLAVNASFAKEDFHGTVEKMPVSGPVGEWIISGKPVQVTKDTKLKEKYGPLRVGAFVEVEGMKHDGKFIAYEIETEEAEKSEK